jgi:hypothetical protein
VEKNQSTISEALVSYQTMLSDVQASSDCSFVPFFKRVTSEKDHSS